MKFIFFLTILLVALVSGSNIEKRQKKTTTTVTTTTTIQPTVGPCGYVQQCGGVCCQGRQYCCGTPEVCCNPIIFKRGEIEEGEGQVEEEALVDKRQITTTRPPTVGPCGYVQQCGGICCRGRQYCCGTPERCCNPSIFKRNANLVAENYIADAVDNNKDEDEEEGGEDQESENQKRQVTTTLPPTIGPCGYVQQCGGICCRGRQYCCGTPERCCNPSIF